MRFEDYREHRVSVLPAGPRGWRAYVDMIDLGMSFTTPEAALSHAEARIDEAWAEQEARERRAQFNDMALFLRSKFVVIQGGRDG